MENYQLDANILSSEYKSLNDIYKYREIIPEHLYS